MASSFNKYTFLKLLLFALFVLMLSHPDLTCTKASSALIMWFHTLVPTLLPVLIISNLIILTRTWDIFIPILHPLLGRFFYLSPSGSFALILGVLCGYPIGSKIVSDLYIKKEISQAEAKRLLTFVSFPSPMFLNGYVLEQCINPITNTVSIAIVTSIYGSALVIGFFQSLIARAKAKKLLHNEFALLKSIEKKTSITFNLSSIQQTLLSSAEVILFVGLYMMLATILAGFLEFYLHTPLLPLFAGMLEMTTGISLLCSSNLSIPIISSIAVFLCCFGGLSITLQTSAVLPKEKGWFFHYFIWKIIHGMIAVILLQFILFCKL